MNPKILLVDDELPLLQGLQRNLRDDFEITLATNGPSALEMLAAAPEDETFAVVMTDYKMPVMNGIDFLREARLVSPTSVRMILTGFADLNVVTEAINEGAVFRFLNKPCAPDQVRKALLGGVEQYKLQQAERELLDRTLMGAVQVFGELLAAFDPSMTTRNRIARGVVRAMTRHGFTEGVWETELAVLLLPLGWFTIPGFVLDKIHQGETLDAEERAMVQKMPQTTARLIQSIPRLEKVIQTIRRAGDPLDALSQNAPPCSWHVLRVAWDLAERRSKHSSFQDAFLAMDCAKGAYHPVVLGWVRASLGELAELDLPRELGPRKVGVKDLTAGMVLNQPVVTLAGLNLLPSKHHLTPSDIERIRNFASAGGIHEPIEVLV